MNARGRPRHLQPSIRMVLSGWLHPENDADILQWWQAIPKGQHMRAFKTALRSGGLDLSGKEPIQTEEMTEALEDFLSHWEL